MDKKKLLIADCTEEFTAGLVSRLQGMFRIRTCSDGAKALALIREDCPDVLLLDLMLPGMDGLSILRCAADAGRRPAVLAVTRFVSDYMLEALSQLGVGYVMRKPCDLAATAQRIMDLAAQSREPLICAPDPRTAADNLLLSLGVRTKLKGYAELREAIPMMAEDPRLSLTKELYPALGKRCRATGVQVERAIRGAIQSAWEQRDEQVWRVYFRAAADGHVPRPTNGAFISRLAECLREEPWEMPRKSG